MRAPFLLKALLIALVHVGSLALVWRALQSGEWGLVLLGALLGHLALDAVTLVVHWTLDNYFSARTPLIGDVVYYFREHHVQPLEMFRRGYVENNFENALVGLLFLVGGLVSSPGPLGSMLLGVGCFGSAYITLIHKLAHLERCGVAGRVLQRLRLIVSPAHHAVHHRGEGRHYGLAAGWLDDVVDALRLLEALEWLIHRLTGVRPVHSRLLPSPGPDTSAP